MSFTLIVDPASSLLPEISSGFKVQMFHKQVKLGNKVYDESQDREVLREFYAAFALAEPGTASIEPFTRDYVHHHFTEYVIGQYDYALVQTATEQVSDLFALNNEVQPFILKTYRAMRERGQLDGLFGVRVMNTGLEYAGLGLVAIYTCELLSLKSSKHDMLLKTDTFKDTVYSYTVPTSSSPRAAQFTERKGLLAGLAGKNAASPIIQTHKNISAAVKKSDDIFEAIDLVFTHLASDIEQGLSYPIITVTYAAEVDGLESLVTYNELLRIAEEKNIEVVTSMMSMTAAVELGYGALSVAFATDVEPYWS